MKKEDYEVPILFNQIETIPHKESRQTELQNLLQVFCIRPRVLYAVLDGNNTLPYIQEFVDNNAISVYLTTDMWTAKNRQGFLGITCSFLDKNFTLHEIILTIEYVRYPHTSENISDTLFYILDEWDLREKVHIIVTDNGANIKKAIKDIGTISKNIKWQSCAAHTLQLIVGKELNLVKLLVLKAKRLIDFFLRPKQSERLEEIQKKSYHIIEVDTGETSDFLLHVIADISTRWNSSYYAWTRLVKVKGYIQALLPELENDSDQSAKKDGKYLRSIMLSLDEWDLLQELIIVLEQATRHLGGEKYVTYSIMYPLVKEIK
ncbi:hypothetical protein RclHR1_19140001 [Rhizophagus clarus]|uniref:DUF659 domain-containing protein n=1 Tax=Rhizophagus clarus TaxID=94130 RepID=A0A2Z6QNQ3_9GLOM|nr:hypothetical protein RclHR1_19140001 [Rhizophagus clarus]